jgi:enoyl-CoA hydratase/carnithine racemase
MSKVYDISKKITNERPTLKLGEGKAYEIDDRKNTMLLLGQKVKESDTEDIKVLDEIVKMALGEEAAKEIDDMELSVTSYQCIVIAIMAAVAGEEYEAAEARFRKEAKKLLE